MMFNLREEIDNYLRYRETLGFDSKSHIYVYNDFAKFVDNLVFESSVLEIDKIMPWCVMRKTETPSGFSTRISRLRQLINYLYAKNLCDGILPSDLTPKFGRYTPYLFSDNELITMFMLGDIEASKPSRTLSDVIASVVYKVIYFCGLRPSEGRLLANSDVDLENGLILIRKNKAHAERLIPMSDDVTSLCRDYSKVKLQYGIDSDYFFPSKSGAPYSKGWLRDKFVKLWNLAYPEKKNVKVRVYDLRHRFATAVLMKWIDEGMDINNALPYLSTYMGHSKLSDTVYYIHLLPERLLNTQNVDWNHFESLIPEVDDYDIW